MTSTDWQTSITVYRSFREYRRFACAVVIPAMNEERRIDACLSALHQQSGMDRSSVLVVIIANNCTDGTVQVAQSIIEKTGLPALIIEAVVSRSEGVGRARSLGIDHAMPYLQERGNVLTTDADCLVDHRWIARSMRALDSMDAVCGLVKPLAGEVIELPVEIHTPGKLEHDYWEVSLEYDAIVDPDPHNPWPHHGRAAGASLGFTRTAYRRSKGFAPIPSGEDRELISRMASSGYRIRYASDVLVEASCRLQGRAPDGMACALARRVADLDSLVDEALEPAHTRIRRVTGRVQCRELLDAGCSLEPLLRALSIDPGIAPPGMDTCAAWWHWIERHSSVLERVRLRPSELSLEIARLKKAVTLARQSHLTAARHAVQQGPCAPAN
ncbi:glycosyltransferase [Granulosicoccus sp. 3-233]|uniref:glycosyltransferase n=1 Tax=Granulosicoccus sp. 3-233 TaxID=3417969 RepID=UPI003D33AB4E